MYAGNCITYILPIFVNRACQILTVTQTLGWVGSPELLRQSPLTKEEACCIITLYVRKCGTYHYYKRMQQEEIQHLFYTKHGCVNNSSFVRIHCIHSQFLTSGVGKEMANNLKKHCLLGNSMAVWKITAFPSIVSINCLVPEPNNPHTRTDDRVV